MNKGIEKATGKIIGIINSDDWYELDAIEAVVRLLEKNENADVIHGGIRFYENDKFKVAYTPKLKELNLCMIPHPACFISKNAYNRFGNYDINYRIAADYDLVARIYSQKGTFVFCNSILANLRLGGASDVQFGTGQKESEGIKSKYKLHYNISLYKKLRRVVKSIIKR
jgi:hypothetical protein